MYVDMSEDAHRSMNKYLGPIRQFSLHTENSIRRIIKNPKGINCNIDIINPWKNFLS